MLASTLEELADAATEFDKDFLLADTKTMKERWTKDWNEQLTAFISRKALVAKVAKVTQQLLNSHIARTK